MASELFNNYIVSLNKGEIDIENDDIKIMLFTEDPGVDIENDVYLDDIEQGNEVSESGTNYSRKTLQNVSIAVIDSTTQALKADNVVWDLSTFEATHGIIFKQGNNDTDSNLICFLDFEGNFSTSNSDFIINWQNNNIITYEKG